MTDQDVVDSSAALKTTDGDVVDPHVILKKAAEEGDIESLYRLIADYQNILEYYDQLSFCETPLHIAAESGKTHFAMELTTLKLSLALKLNTSGLSPIHVALKFIQIKSTICGAIIFGW